VDPQGMIFHEQDFVLITDSKGETDRYLLGLITILTHEKNNAIKGTVSILGEFKKEKYKLFPSRVPISMDADINRPPEGIVSKVLSYQEDDGIYIGDIITSPISKDPFFISPEFLERHVLCVASTGAGKSYSIGVLLEEILLKFKKASVLLFDVHNEYWGLAQENTGAEIADLVQEGYFPREFSSRILVFEKESLGLGKKFGLQRIRRLLELSSAQENALMNILKDPEDLKAIEEKIEKADIHTGTRENLKSKITALKRLNLFSKELDISSLVKPGQISIIRLDQYTDEKKRAIMVNELLNQVFKKKISGKIPKDQEIIVILEEAHRFAHKSEILVQIAREGRKFGIYEILVSQRPGDLPDDIIANMNTLVALRIKSEKDTTKIRLMEGINTDTVAILPHLVKGEALIVGLQGEISIPIRIRVRPRLTKHIDPQIHQMPSTIRRYIELNAIQDLKVEMKEVKKVNEHKFEKIIPSNEIIPFDQKDLTNLLSFEHILILHKNTGICLFGFSTTILRIDPQLVSGFLTAISSLFSELKDEMVKNRTIIREFTEEIADRAFHIITVEGKYSVTAIILDRPPKFKSRLKSRMREFVYSFEDRFEELLERFLGELDPFMGAISLLDYYLGLSLLGPFRLDYEKEEETVARQIFAIIKEQIDQLAHTEGLFIREIVNQCLFNSDMSRTEIIETIINFYQNKLIFPNDSSRILPPFYLSEIEKDESEEEVEKPETPEEMSILFEEPSKIASEKPVTAWIIDLITSIQKSTVPDQLKEDILSRDIIFESQLQLRNNALTSNIYTESELENWLFSLSENGYSLKNSLKNPLNGVKFILSSTKNEFILSIAFSGENKFVCVMGLLS
jgi:DNA helicase HerA-like ATPase